MFLIKYLIIIKIEWSIYVKLSLSISISVSIGTDLVTVFNIFFIVIRFFPFLPLIASLPLIVPVILCFDPLSHVTCLSVCSL